MVSWFRFIQRIASSRIRLQMFYSSCLFSRNFTSWALLLFAAMVVSPKYLKTVLEGQNISVSSKCINLWLNCSHIREMWAMLLHIDLFLASYIISYCREWYTICLNTWLHIWIVQDYLLCQYFSFLQLPTAHWHTLTFMPNGKLVLVSMWHHISKAN